MANVMKSELEVDANRVNLKPVIKKYNQDHVIDAQEIAVT